MSFSIFSLSLNFILIVIFTAFADNAWPLDFPTSLLLVEIMQYIMSDCFLFSKLRLVEIFFTFCIIVPCLLNSKWLTLLHIMCLFPVFLHSHVAIGLIDVLQAVAFCY